MASRKQEKKLQSMMRKEIKRQAGAIAHDFAAYRNEIYLMRFIDRFKFALQTIAGRDLGFTQQNLDEKIKE